MSDARLLLASGNQHKLIEFREMCAPLGLDVIGPAQWVAEGGAPLPDVDETETTFLGNALLKAASAHRATGLNVLADDSGLAVDALGGAPGVKSARYAGPQATDAENRALLLNNLGDVPAGKRQAAFHCVLVLCGPLAEGPGCGRTDDGLPWRAFAGKVEGEILTAEVGDGGFGYDALFAHAGLGQTFAQAAATEKHAVSHRGRAFARLQLYLGALPAQLGRGRPMYLKPAGMQALAQAIDGVLGRHLRHADAALEQALGDRPELGGKERAAIADMHWHTLRRLSFLHLARLAMRGTDVPSRAPDPRSLMRTEAPLLACLALADVDPAGLPRDHLRKGVHESALSALCERNPGFVDRLPDTLERLDAALRSATWALSKLPEADRVAMELGVNPTLWLALKADMGEASARLALGYLNNRGPLVVRANPLRAAPAAVVHALDTLGVQTLPVPELTGALLCLQSGRLTRLPLFESGGFEVQDEGSQHITRAVGAAPGMTIIDWCAGAGGKSLGLAGALAGKGRLIALDTHRQRLDECDRRLRRAGVHNAETRWLQGGKAHGLPMADAVLVDAPCTSTGALRRNPELRWQIDEAWLGRFPEQQLTILRRASEHVRPGGRVVYATCSLLKRENESVVATFLASSPQFRKVSETRVGPANAAFLDTHPLAPIGPDGFYFCVLERTDSAHPAAHAAAPSAAPSAAVHEAPSHD